MQMRDAVRTQGEHTRRAGLVGAAALGALMLAGLAFAWPQSPRSPDGPGAHAAPAVVAQARARIKHIVFVLLENHSFDNVFGRFPGADGATAARSGTQTIPLLHAPPFYWHDIFHEYADANSSIDKGKMDGFSLEEGADLNGDRMAYQQYTPADIPHLWAYAQHFTLGDHMFASSVGSTFPNHLYSVAAQSGGVVTNVQAWHNGWGCDSGAHAFTLKKAASGTLVGAGTCFRFATLADTMERAHLSWTYYAARSHPPYGICAAETWVVAQLNALMQGPDWPRTAVVLVWDDWGGRYDHV